MTAHIVCIRKDVNLSKDIDEFIRKVKTGRQIAGDGFVYGFDYRGDGNQDPEERCYAEIKVAHLLSDDTIELLCPDKQTLFKLETVSYEEFERHCYKINLV